MSVKQTLYILLLLTALTGCSALRKKPLHQDIQPLSSITLSLLDGSYPNQPDSSRYSGGDINALWRQLKLRKRYKLVEQHGNLTVHIKAINQHTLQAYLMDGQLQLDKKKLKGRIKDGAFYLRGKHAFYGLPLIYWASLGLETRLATNGSGLLIAESKYAHGGGIFIISAGSTDDCTMFYNKR